MIVSEDAVCGHSLSDRYAGQFPLKTECMMQHSLNWVRQQTGSQRNNGTVQYNLTYGYLLVPENTTKKAGRIAASMNCAFF